MVLLLTLLMLARIDPITVAAAADLQPAMQAIVAGYEHDTGQPVRVIYGASGTFYSQIENGAPFDLFFSADAEYPQRLVREGLLWSAERYASGHLVLWVSDQLGVDPAQGLAVLSNVQHIAIANPQHAPYGRAAVAALQRAGLYGALQRRLVLGENVSQAAWFAASGNAQAALLPRSLVGALPGHWAPVADVPALPQDAGILKSTHQRVAAEHFLHYVTAGPGRAVLERFGFQAGVAPTRSEK
ncbi:MAG: molybdate ABC transporter substrate-binding protein [Candidatus Xenobia bacterium]